MRSYVTPGVRVMVTRGHREHDTMSIVGTMGTIVAVYSNDPIHKDRNEFCVAVRLDSRIRHDGEMLFRASDLADCQINRKASK